MTTSKMTQAEMTREYNKMAGELNEPLVKRLRDSKTQTVAQKYEGMLAAWKTVFDVKEEVKEEPKKAPKVSPNTKLADLASNLQNTYPELEVKTNKHHIRVSFLKNTFYVYSSREGFKVSVESNNRHRFSKLFAEVLKTDFSEGVWADVFANVEEEEIIALAEHIL